MSDTRAEGLRLTYDHARREWVRLDSGAVVLACRGCGRLVAGHPVSDPDYCQACAGARAPMRAGD